MRVPLSVLTGVAQDILIGFFHAFFLFYEDLGSELNPVSSIRKLERF